MASATSTTPAFARPGVSGEFHSQGGLFLAARLARRRGFAADSMFFIADPSTDPTGEPVGFVRPVSTVRELAGAGAVLGLLTGLIWALSVPSQHAPLLPRAVVDSLLGLICGGLLGWLGGWAHLSVLAGKYLQTATAGGSLRLKIVLPADLAEPERDRQAELAERVLREAKAETLIRFDGTLETNSPQSAAYLA